MTSPDAGPQLTADLAVEYERTFMKRLSARIEETESFIVPPDGRSVRGRARRDAHLSRDFSPEVDRLLRAEGIHDPVLFDRLPKGRRVVWDIRTGGLLARRTAFRVCAASTHPFRDLALGRSPSALHPDEASRWLVAAIGEDEGGVSVVFSSSGWRSGSEDPRLFLFQPAPGGGFMALGRDPELVPAFLSVADEDELVQRVLAFVAAERVELVLRGIELERTSARTGVPEALVREAFIRAATEGEFLRVAKEDGTIVLRRA